MRSPLAVLATVLLIVGVVACGNTGKGADPATRSSSSAITSSTSATATSSAAPPGGYLKEDGDKDNDDSGNRNSRLNDDQAFLASYGKEADRADKQAIAAVVKSYYAAATAENGAKACSLLDSSLASGLASTPSQPGQGAGQTCATAASKLYKLQHAQLVADDAATMVVTDVRVKGSLGLAVLGFRSVPEGEILVEREGSAWKVDALFNSEMT